MCAKQAGKKISKSFSLVVIATLTEMPALLQSARTLKHRGPRQVSFPGSKSSEKRRMNFGHSLRKATDISANENSGAEIFDDTMKRLEFVNGVSEALNWYVSDRRFQAKLPTFREQLKDLRKAIERFQSSTPY